MKNEIMPAVKRIVNHPLFIGTIYLLLIPIFAFIYWNNPQSWSDTLTPIKSIYFSVVTITTLGFGDIYPVNDIARILTAIESVIGIVIIGFFLNRRNNPLACQWYEQWLCQ
jgi:voltage-gated potassium channel Kch